MRALRWLGDPVAGGSLQIRRADGNSTGAAGLGAGSTSLVKPYNPETGDSGLIKRPENIAALGETRIRDLIAAGTMEEVELYEGNDRRSGVDRRQVDRRQS